ncbi:MAG: hypothetical protein CM15mP62_17690 [Rhodospirillaceae bacterium]|nr:MAG: hypothetical protein CM15mP62_17690 [Rhodospirillaceae bacterium]
MTSITEGEMIEEATDRKHVFLVDGRDLYSEHFTHYPP